MRGLRHDRPHRQHASNQAPDLAITEVKIPIQPHDAIPAHAQDRARRAAGNHVWITTGGARRRTRRRPDGQEPGPRRLQRHHRAAGDLDPPQQGYVGYAWKASQQRRQRLRERRTGAVRPARQPEHRRGQRRRQRAERLRQRASLCGYQPGVRIAYNLLTHDALNFYLDTTDADAPAGHARSAGVSPARVGPPVVRHAEHRFRPAACCTRPGTSCQHQQRQSQDRGAEAPAGGGRSMPTATAQSTSRARLSGIGSRPGLITSPVAAAISPDGVILVLESAATTASRPSTSAATRCRSSSKQTDAVLPAARRRPPGVHLPRPGGRIHGLPVRAVARTRATTIASTSTIPTRRDTQPICTTLGVNAASSPSTSGAASTR